jgi:uncharacterized membrane protein YciS (DUF1049 family)
MPFLSVINMMKWINKIIVTLIVIVAIAAGVVLAILNPQKLSINLWGWVTIEHTIAAWSLMVLAFGIVIGVIVASVLIIRLQSQLYMSQRKLFQWQSMLDAKESKK